MGLALEVGGSLELFDGVLAPGVEFLFQPADGAPVPGVVGAGVGVLLGCIHQPRGEFADEIHVLDEVAAGLGQRVEFGEPLSSARRVSARTVSSIPWKCGRSIGPTPENTPWPLRRAP